MSLFESRDVESHVGYALVDLAVALARLFNVLATDIEKDNKTTTMHKGDKK